MFIFLLFYSKSWRVYGRNAEGVREALAASHPELHVVLNPEKPRRNSFEVTLMEGDKGKTANQYPYTCLFLMPLSNMIVQPQSMDVQRIIHTC